MKLDELPIGHPVFVAVQRTDGYDSFWLGCIDHVSPMEIGITNAVRVVNTGRINEFWKGKYDDKAEWEPLHPEAVHRLPRWGTSVTDWPHEIPTSAR